MSWPQNRTEPVDAARRADDEGDAPLEPSVHSSFSLILSLTASSSTAASTSPPRIICV